MIGASVGGTIGESVGAIGASVGGTTGESVGGLRPQGTDENVRIASATRYPIISCDASSR